MAERPAHLVDDVFPDVAVRQWVLTLPHRIRYLLAWDHERCRAVVAVYLRAVLGFLRHRARVDGVVDGRGGAVATIQRRRASARVLLYSQPLPDSPCARKNARRSDFATSSTQNPDPNLLRGKINSPP
jgi:hypothetical protein